MLRDFVISKMGLEAANPREFTPQSYDPDPILKRSFLGTPVWSNLVIPAGNYETLEGDVIFFEGISIDSVLMSVSMQRNIVTTAVAGRNGTVKEFISDGDFSISIGGVLAGPSQDVYPSSDLASLIEVLRAPVSIKVESEFLSFFGIEEVVFTGFDFPQTKGTRNLQFFNISAISDEPIELRTI